MIEELIDRKRRLFVEQDRLAVKLYNIEIECQDIKTDYQDTRFKKYRVIKVENMIGDQGDRRSIKGIDDKSGVDLDCEGTINGMQKTRGSIPWYTYRYNGFLVG